MNPVNSKIYDLVVQIPAGKVATYGQLAALTGNPGDARSVGWAMSSAPRHRNLPCHRVVNRQGDLAPEYVFGGREVQRAMLESEGVTFRPDGRINMAKHLWEGPHQDLVSYPLLDHTHQA